MTKVIKVILSATAFTILVGVGWFFWDFASDFAPGSYPFAQTYVIHAPESKVISTIERFKSSHPDFQVPIVFVDSVRPQILIGGRGKSFPNYWYHVYFYCRESNEILHTWTRPAADSTKTTFALVGLNRGRALGGNWKRVNKDLQKLENKNVIKLFEDQILFPIKDLIAKDTTYVGF